MKHGLLYFGRLVLPLLSLLYLAPSLAAAPGESDSTAKDGVAAKAEAAVPTATESRALQDTLRMIRALTRTPKILTKDPEEVLQLMPGCVFAKDVAKEEDKASFLFDQVLCPGLPSLDRIFVNSGNFPGARMNFQFRSPPLKCPELFAIVRKGLGKPEALRSMSLKKCDVHWSLSPKVKKGHANLYTFSMDPSILIFQMDIESGP
jgi:hypothetical protein